MLQWEKQLRPESSKCKGMSELGMSKSNKQLAGKFKARRRGQRGRHVSGKDVVLYSKCNGKSRMVVPGAGGRRKCRGDDQRV